MTRERDIERYLREQCRAEGFLCYKFVSPAHAGVPDRVIMTPAGTIFVEVKKPGEEPRPLQIEQHRKMRAAGARIFVVDDRPGIDGLIAQLREAARSTEGDLSA